MIKVVSVETMREIEAAADAAGVSYATMMDNAGRATADRALAVLEGIPDARVTVLIGPGNNGGDGLVAGRLIAEDSAAEVRFYLLKKRDDSDPNFKAAHEAGLFMAYAEDDKDQRAGRNMVASADLVIDALFGVGVRLPIKGDAEKLLRSVNQALNESRPVEPVNTSINPALPHQMKQASRPYVLAVDCPSGLDCDTGELDQAAIHADETITFLAAKPGLIVFPGAEAVGDLYVAPIGVSPDLEPLQNAQMTLIDSEAVRNLLPDRPANSHKGTYGKALIAAGSINYSGAPGLAAQAAYRSGAGLVTVAAPHPVVAALSAKLTEPTWLLLPHDMGVISDQAVKVLLKEAINYNALLLGPGWGRENTTRDFLANLFGQSGQAKKSRTQRTIGFASTGEDTTDQESDEEITLPPVVIDADGLNLLSEIDEWWKLLPPHTILTPHPAEMARLAKSETSDVQVNRLAMAQSKAAEWDVVIVLKGAHTVIAAPDGRTAVLPFKVDALATAGTGDVLAGMIVSLLGQGLEPFDAATAGSYLHGLAGYLATDWGSSRSVIAGDVVDSLGAALEMVERV